MSEETRAAVIRAFERCLLDGEGGEPDICEVALDTHEAAIRAETAAMTARLAEALRPFLLRGDAGHTSDGCAPMYGCACGLASELEEAAFRLAECDAQVSHE